MFTGVALLLKITHHISFLVLVKMFLAENDIFSFYFISLQFLLHFKLHSDKYFTQHDAASFGCMFNPCVVLEILDFINNDHPAFSKSLILLYYDQILQSIFQSACILSVSAGFVFILVVSPYWSNHMHLSFGVKQSIICG